LSPADVLTELPARFNFLSALQISKQKFSGINSYLFSDITANCANGGPATFFLPTPEKNYEVDVSSNNSSIAVADRSVRSFLSKETFSQIDAFNFFSTKPLAFFSKNEKSAISSGELNYFFLINKPVNRINSFSKILINRANQDYPHSPVVSNNSLTSILQYDSRATTLIDGVPTVLQSKEEAIPASLASIY